MRRKSLAVAVVLIGFAAQAQADMIETKDRGLINGKILSQDSNEVRFEDTRKNIIVVPRNEVLFLEEQKDSPLQPAQTQKNFDWKGLYYEWKQKASRLFRDVKHNVEKHTAKARSFIEAPLDRSGADSKSQALNDSMNSLVGTLGKMAKNDRKQAHNKKIMTNWKDYKDSSSTRQGHYKDADAGNFSSL